MNTKLTHIPIIILLVSTQLASAPTATSELLKMRQANERWIEAIVSYDGYKKLLRQTSSENTLAIVRLIETSEYPEMIRAIIEVESSWRVKARSHRDARGLMQIRPIAARQVDPALPPDKLFDPVVNVAIGIQIFQDHMEYFMGYDDPEMWALTSYNRGRSGTFALDMQPPDTRYSRKVLHRIDEM
ncbi:lytic transglycosylase domain-containing protein [Calditrichota bacterium]